MNLRNNEVEFYSTVSFEELSDIKTALNELNNKINNLTRQVTFWDVYNITVTLLSENDYLSKVPGLNVGEAAVVNVNMIKVGEDYYYRGDIIYKQLDGTLLHIPAENSGIYVPNMTLDKNGQIVISYSYTPSVQDDIDTTFTWSISGSDFGYCDLKNLTTFTVSGDRVVWTKTMIAQYNNPTVYIYPSIKFYLEREDSIGEFEEIFPDYYYTVSGSSLTISVPATLQDLCGTARVKAVWVRLR